MFNPDIFREYDIRGIVTDDLKDDVVTSIGKAYGTYMIRHGARHVTLGRDVRTTSPHLRDQLLKGMLSTGLNVTDVGVVPTPVLYYSIVHEKADGGMMLTGSHNPREYNGFKMCLGLGSLHGEEIQKLREMIEKDDFEKGSGTVKEINLDSEYLDMITSKIKLQKKLKVVIDSGNGTAGILAPEIFRRLGCEVIELYCEPDGTFPNHLPDPTKLEYVRDLMALVQKEKADVGIGYDGDTDRVGIIDEKGRIVWADKLLALLAREIGSKLPGSTVVFDVKCSQGLVEDIEKHGCKPLMWKTGHSLLKAKMKELGTPLAGEMSGHIFYADDFFGYDDAIYVSARMMQILAASEDTMSAMADSVPAFVSTPEIRVECSDKEKFSIVSELVEFFRAQYNVIDVDGVRVLFGDGWGLVRASNTQPVLVMRFEAKTEKRLNEIIETMVSKIETYPSVKINRAELKAY